MFAFDPCIINGLCMDMSPGSKQYFLLRSHQYLLDVWRGQNILFGIKFDHFRWFKKFLILCSRYHSHTRIVLIGVCSCQPNRDHIHRLKWPIGSILVPAYRLPLNGFLQCNGRQKSYIWANNFLNII